VVASPELMEVTICIYVYIYICIYVYIYISIHISRIYVYIYMHTHVYIYVILYICVSLPTTGGCVARADGFDRQLDPAVQGAHAYTHVYVDM